MTKNIRVLQLGSPIGLYGAERWILALIKHLDSTRIETIVASIKDDPHAEVPLCREAELLGFRTNIFEQNGKISIKLIKQIKNFILDKGIEILHTHGYKTDIIGMMAVKGTKCKIVSTPHGWTNQPDFKLRLYEIINRFIFPFFDAVVPLSEELYNSLRWIPRLESKLHLINNAVDTNEIEAEKEIAGEILSLKDTGAFVIGYIGRLIRGKGLDVLVRAVAQYSEPKWYVVIIGEGEEYFELKLLIEKSNIEKKVQFFGFRSDRLSFLNGFDVFVLPSRSEGTPRCLMESMAAGIPVIASNIPGCRKLVDGKTTGLLFEMDNKKELADSIFRIYSDKEFKKSISQCAKKFIKINYSADSMAKNYTDLYYNLVTLP